MRSAQPFFNCFVLCLIVIVMIMLYIAPKAY